MSDTRWVSAPPDSLGYRVRSSLKPDLPPAIMLHGWGGDENVMWVFEGVLPEGGLIAAPRGIFPVEGGGFNWVTGERSSLSEISDFSLAAEGLTMMLETLDRHSDLDHENLVLM